MGKKKKRGNYKDSQEDQDDVSTDEDVNNDKSDLADLPNCPHVGKAVNPSSIKKALKPAWLRIGACGACKRANAPTRAPPVNLVKGKNAKNQPAAAPTPAIAAKDLDKSKGVWMCLNCGNQMCGSSVMKDNSQAGHCFVHYKTPRSDLHCAYVNTETWALYCFMCEEDLYIDSYKKLRDVVELVKKVAAVKGISVSSATAASSTPGAGLKRPSQFVKANSDSQQALVQKVRGLTNLGNTCFFNAVMQCLSQSHPLTHVLDQHCQKGAQFTTPTIPIQIPSLPQQTNKTSSHSDGTDSERSSGQIGDSGICSENSSASGTEEPSSVVASSTSKNGLVVLDPLSLQLNEAGPITLALAAFLKDMNSMGKPGTVNPGHLFGQVCRKSPQFRGFQQQDAHELLRHLMDSLRTEEVKRQKSAILKQFGLSEKTDPKTVPQGIRRKLQAIGRYSNHTLVDKIFGGQLVSTIVCEQCHNSSQMYEPFLDLSLPLVEEKPQRPTKNNNANKDDDDDDDSVKISCFGGTRKKNNQDLENGGKKSKAELKREKERLKKERRKNKKNAKNSGNAQEDKEEIEPVQNDQSKEVEGEEEKLRKELVENEKDNQESEEIPEQIETEEQPEQQQEAEAAVTTTTLPALSSNNVQDNKSAFESAAKSKNDAQKPNRVLDGDEEDEEDGYTDDEGDWEWDYGEQTKSSLAQDDQAEQDDDNTSSYLEVDELDKAKSIPEVPRVSLNPLPPERLARSSEEREKSSEPIEEEADSESNQDDGDVEDNLDEQPSMNKFAFNVQDFSDFKPFKPDPDRLDPHMEALCRKVRKLSVSIADPDAEPDDKVDGALITKEYVMSNQNDNNTNADDPNPENPEETSSANVTTTYDQSSSVLRNIDKEKHQLRLQNDWIARSLTSIAARYHAKSGECSVYSCLTQFTAPELLTGTNKWACEKCTRLALERTPESDASDKENKPKTVYSNASKQLLVFCPPAVLTIHLKRFQQTMYNLKKVNRHVSFPLKLDLAPFCSSTSLSMPTVSGTASEIIYDLFGVVEHSGRLQGGHYTAYVKVRPTIVNKSDSKKFYSAPTARNEEIVSLLAEIHRKSKEAEAETATSGCDNPEDSSDNNSASVSKWYHISDTHVTEASEDKVLKCQAYLLFYERIK